MTVFLETFRRDNVQISWIPLSFLALFSYFGLVGEKHHHVTNRLFSFGRGTKFAWINIIGRLERAGSWHNSLRVLVLIILK